MDTPDFFVGARLGGARIKAGISLEKAAKDTRIRVQRLREIEADDFSGFAHPTYSRLFLLDYAEYLGISPDEIRPLLPDRAGAAGGGFQYINSLSRVPLSPVVPLRPARPNLFRIIAVVGLVFLVAAAGIFASFTIKKIKRVAGSAAVTGKPLAVETPTPVPQPSPEPATVEGSLPTMRAIPVDSPVDSAPATPAPSIAP